jgi:hypothetical protein
MGTSSWLATLLDQEMLEVQQAAAIASRGTPDSQLQRRSGADVARELGNRYLLRYLLPHQLGQFQNGSSGKHCLTPTPYSPEETISWLALPQPTEPRTYVMLLDPARISVILGPRWVRLGKGIEYVLPDGFPQDAIVFRWEVPVT